MPAWSAVCGACRHQQVNVASPSTVIRAPFAGVVIKAQTAPGDVFDADRELFSIADLSRVWVQAEVYERGSGRVKVGRRAVITVILTRAKNLKAR